MYINKNCINVGETGPGCSAHAEGCDGSTGILKKKKKFKYGKIAGKFNKKKN